MRKLTVYEYQTIRLGHQQGSTVLRRRDLEQLQLFHENMELPYYQLQHRGLRFQQYVGVLQVGDLLIEILPKTDKHSEEAHWRGLLLGMLQAVGHLPTSSPSTASLQLRPNSLLDAYIELFVQELEQLLHSGLIKQYHAKEGQQKALKGQLLFAQQLKHNIVRRDRFYTRHRVYDQQHLLHQILWETLLVLPQLQAAAPLHSRIARLQLYFPEQQRLRVRAVHFEKLPQNRKTAAYRKALKIARLILLRYHPSLRGGQEQVLALLFDMNQLWESFIFHSLRRHAPQGFRIKEQVYKRFWKGEGQRVGMKPDILIEGPEARFVLDTKWKNIGNAKPSPADLRQLYVYLEYYQAQQAALVYPGTQGIRVGHYYEAQSKQLSARACSILKIDQKPSIFAWQQAIAQFIFEEWVGAVAMG